MKRVCPFCHSTDTSLLFKSKDYNRQVTKEFFSHYRCSECKLIFIDPVPVDLGQYYPQEYYHLPNNADELKIGFPHEQYKIDLVKKFKAKGRLLEIGPSLGCFTYLAQCSGFDAEAIEMDERCSKFLNEVVGIPTVNTADASAALKKLPGYDVITLWHVIEHMPNPWEMLEAIAKNLNVGGIAVMAAPNPNAFQFKVMRRFWPHVDAPRHVMLIPSDLIIDRLTSLGMVLELNTTNDRGGLGWNIFGWEFFLADISSTTKVNQYLRKIGRMMAKLFSRFDTVEGKGSAYTLVLRKVK